MKYQESYLGTRAEFGEFVKKAVPELFSGRLTVEGKSVSLPADAELDYKVKYDEDEQGGSVTIKVAWEKESLEIDLDD
ncbi:MAG: transcription initiation factor IIE [Clostridiales bacterium GWC2_40_7]|nr:MAG: transcription initiation factor IIE [Clostridiales bacterium GWC2_40_7]